VNDRITRRRLLTAGVAAVAGGLGVAGWRAAGQSGLLAPDHDGLYGLGEALTYGTQRLLTAHQPPAREFTRRDISRVAPVNGDPPETDAYLELAGDDFARWRLAIDGLVARPQSLSLAELMRMPSRTQITMHVCEEGWSYIAEWTGVPVAALLDRAGASSRGRFVVFRPFDQWWDSLDIAEARHPQTLLAYSMNGQRLPMAHGAPVRLRVPRQLGYKSIKYLARIDVVESLASVGDGRGSASPAAGYSWYAGI
jgi:DMSO/TMAO reductase YedYZ molybdopterin-dependent catalytic subunit